MSDTVTLELLRRFLRGDPTPIGAGDDIGAWWRLVQGRDREFTAPIDRAILAGFAGDRVACVLAGGYQAALRAMVPSLAGDGIVTFCATEEGGNHPRAIATALTASAGGGQTLRGAKRWSTMGPLADQLLVVASEGMDADGRTRLRLVRVDRSTPGVSIRPMPATRFVPEVPHAAVDLVDVPVQATDALPGDGYARYVKPFRTVEDVHIHGALLGYLVSVARRHGFPREAVERLAASVLATRALAGLDPAEAETHLALAGLLAQDARVLDELAPAWAQVADDERERWQRDRALWSVAGQPRERRRERAWETVSRDAR